MIFKAATIAFLLFMLYRIVFSPSKSLTTPNKKRVREDDNVVDVDYEEME